MPGHSLLLLGSEVLISVEVPHHQRLFPYHLCTNRPEMVLGLWGHKSSGAILIGGIYSSQLLLHQALIANGLVHNLDFPPTETKRIEHEGQLLPGICIATSYGLVHLIPRYWLVRKLRMCEIIIYLADVCSAITFIDPGICASIRTRWWLAVGGILLTFVSRNIRDQSLDP